MAGLGLRVAPITAETRERFGLRPESRGVVIIEVAPGGPAAERELRPGDVIVEVQQEPATSPDALARRIETLKKDGKKSVLLLVSNAQGDTRFVAVSIE